MKLLIFLGFFVIGILFFIGVIHFTTWLERHYEKKWMQKTTENVILTSGILIGFFSAILIATLIRIGLLITGVL